MARFDLSDAEWQIIRPLLPSKPRAPAREDERPVLNGIFDLSPKFLPPRGKSLGLI
ncbi:hypothetical protein ACFMBG_15655 [Leisingera sp. D0M16]|uniref:hypothetical protein n=1 Tax=Leisingera coralii TaxID=3351347 RepID=UPI003B816286